MAYRHRFEKVVRLARLHEELLAAEVPLVANPEADATGGWLTLSDASVTAAAAAVIAAHNPANLSSVEAADANDEQVLAGLIDFYQDLKADIATGLGPNYLTTEALWGGLTQTERERRTRLVLVGVLQKLDQIADVLRVLVQRSGIIQASAAEALAASPMIPPGLPWPPPPMPEPPAAPPTWIAAARGARRPRRRRVVR